jgi:radical S-adenosyl methionine domain-containing protein 2
MLLKLNCVVNMTGLMLALAPDKWKVFKMKAFSNNSFDNRDLGIGMDEYKKFITMHSQIENLVEESEMAGSYIMVDPKGCLIDNTSSDYRPAANLLEDDFMDSFTKLPFNEKLYRKRYHGKHASDHFA